MGTANMVQSLKHNCIDQIIVFAKPHISLSFLTSKNIVLPSKLGIYFETRE